MHKRRITDGFAHDDRLAYLQPGNITYDPCINPLAAHLDMVQIIRIRDTQNDVRIALG